jgi:hypothetical protein
MLYLYKHDYFSYFWAALKLINHFKVGERVSCCTCKSFNVVEIEGKID